MSALDRFHPSTRRWFEDRFAAPTRAQAESWPLIADGDHVLVTAPTGSGKTLTAFLWSLDGFTSGRLTPGATRVLYVSPLKALNNDIQRNLLGPLRELAGDYGAPEIRVATRSGDTDNAERQRLLRRPPEILVTTPESLNLMLSTRRGQQALATIECVIVDEIHAIIDNRRGTSLLTSLERLVELCGEFQRIALSATVRPLEAVAAAVAGRDADGKPRPMALVNAATDKQIVLSVHFPEAARRAAEDGVPLWEPLADAFREHVGRNRSTLFFTNSRRLTEKITLKINEGTERTLAYAHHGSLARDLRQEVERRLKAGELSAIVATNSLEMGIDIGALDEVVLVQSPTSIASALQRLGRAGHQVDAVSRGALYPTHAHDFLEAAVVATGIAQRDIEPAAPLRNPLDVLAQIIISICAFEPRDVNELFELLRRSGPYETLPRESFDALIEMLAGRYQGSKIRELKARLRFDRVANQIQANRGAVLAMYLGGGSIPERGYYQLRHVDNGALIGELDEEFVWEATTGQTFTLGSQAWQITRITHNDVLVRPASQGSELPPFWRAEAFNRSSHFSQAIVHYLDHAEAALAAGESAALIRELSCERGFDEAAATELVDYLQAQREALGLPLPGPHRLIIEQVHTAPGGYAGPMDPRQTIIHSYWGGGVNRPWALALAAVWPDHRAGSAEVHADNNAIVLQHRGPLDIEALLGAVTSATLLPLLKGSLEGSGFFGARFRECAGRALLLGRARFKQRLPLWLIRMQAKKLMQSVQQFEDFPLLQETWRSCLHDEFDLPLLTEILDQLADGALRVDIGERRTPSPFAANVTFEQISRYMYASDDPEGNPETALRDDVLALAMADREGHPQVPPEIIERFEEKRQRRAPGYEPTDAADWIEWIKERALLPRAEWPADETLRSAIEASGRILRVTLAPAEWWLHTELALTWQRAGALGDAVLTDRTGATVAAAELPLIDDEREASTLLLECLTYFGPRTEAELRLLLPALPETLLTREELLRGQLVKDSDAVWYCDAENFEALLRFARAARRSTLPPLPLTDWPERAWRHQGGHALGTGSTTPEPDADRSAMIIERCRGYPGPPGLWLEDLLTARLPGWDPHRLETRFAEDDLRWTGIGRETVSFFYPEELPLLATATVAQADREKIDTELERCFADPHGRYDFAQLAERSSAGTSAGFNDHFWEAVWHGLLSSDSLAALRAGVRDRFRLGEGLRAGRRRLLRPGPGWPGTWHWQPLDAAHATDPLSELESAKEAARLLLDRHGVICRELANRDHPALRWSAVFKALRIMELAGEVQAGLFYEGFSGPQFARPEVPAQLHRARSPAAFWLAASDPAAPCGLGLKWPGPLKPPARRRGNYLAFAEGELALVVHNDGRRLAFAPAPSDAGVLALLPVLVHLARSRRSITVERINDEPALTSPYRSALAQCLNVTSDHRHLYLSPLP
ncbi:MAG: DEAD/DEAH box helicase [Pseudomonadota bacterium]